jgi:uroporphyrinogen decarboxylase
MKRRRFFAVTGLATSRLIHAAPRSKRERMTEWLEGKTDPRYTPAAFFLHFAPEYHGGPAAARKHLEFYRATDMDFVKIQFEQTYKPQAFLKTPADWAKLELRKASDYEPLMVAVREIVKAVKKEALIVMTLYSPFMHAGHVATAAVLQRHLEEDPEKVKKGMEILTESQMQFVRACIGEGVDGFYMSTQGSERGRYSSGEIFARYIKPYDLAAMKVIARECPFNILHVCDYVAPYANYRAVLEYPGQIVNANTRLTDATMGTGEIAKAFGRPYMGGMDRHGVLVKGSAAEVRVEVRRVIGAGPRQFILGADCTVAAETEWQRLRGAIDAAHGG